MQVFLVPLGTSAHVPYCEPADGDHAPGSGESRGWFGGLVQRFRDVIAVAEQSRLSPEEQPPVHGWAGRIKARALRWIADHIAEQRLLWQLRGCDAATLIYPSDLTAETAMALLCDELQRDGDRHRRWMVVHALLFVLSGVLAIVPGPNLIAYYFAFRAVGHFLSMRGARHGLHDVAWTPELSPDLVDLRAALHLEPHVRHHRVRDIATRLELPHLATFVERVALKGA
jgi:hypothetical protein